jgi:hypothetical protein
MKLFYRILCLILLSGNVSAQTLHGYVVDKNNFKPVADCIIILKGEPTPAVSNSKGEFNFPKTEKDKASLIFTMIGYVTIEYKLSAYKKDTFFISPKNISLKEIEIQRKPKKILNEKSNESILDFDLLNKDVILLTAGMDHNYLRLIDDSGNKISNMAVDKNTESLKHDCLTNLQLFNKDSVWQIFYDYEKLNLLNACSKQTYSRVLENCVCSCDHNYYFKTMEYRNLRANYFYYNEFEKRKRHELIQFKDSSKMRRFALDYDLNYFLEQRRKFGLYPESVDSIKAKIEMYRAALPLDWSYSHWLGSVETEMIKTDSGLYLLNFTDTSIFQVNKNNEVKFVSRLNCLHYKDLIHKVYLDAENNETYVISFSGSNLTFIKFNLASGKEISQTSIPNIPYLPKKIIVHSHEAYYIEKNLADQQVYKMVRYRLD